MSRGAPASTPTWEIAVRGRVSCARVHAYGCARAFFGRKSKNCMFVFLARRPMTVGSQVKKARARRRGGRPQPPRPGVPASFDPSHFPRRCRIAGVGPAARLRPEHRDARPRRAPSIDDVNTNTRPCRPTAHTCTRRTGIGDRLRCPPPLIGPPRSHPAVDRVQARS